MDIQKQLAMAAVAKAHKRNGTTPPPELIGQAPPKTKTPIKTGADPKQSSKAKNAAAAALASRLGGGQARVSPTSAMGGSGPSNSEVIDKYRKMVKMGVPAGAIRGKMSAEGIPPKVIEDVLSGGGGGGGGPSSGARPRATPGQAKNVGGGSSALTPKEESIASQYRRMLKIGLPDGAIRHKMTSDGVPQHIQDSVLAGEVPGGMGGSSSSSQTSAPPARFTSGGGSVSKLSPKEESIAAQYRRMAKIGLPDGAIRHKMVSDGVPQRIQDSVLAGEVPAAPGQQVQSGSENGGISSSDGRGTMSNLTPSEEQIAAQYRKMVKMGLPDGAVIHKMSMDGVAKNIQDSVLARETPATHVESSGFAGGSSAAFAAGAAALRSAPKSSPGSVSSAETPKGSPLAIAAAAAAARRGTGPPKPPREVPQNPKPVLSGNASGPGALAAAAVAAAARRSKRQDSNPLEQFNSKPSKHQVNAAPAHMVTLKKSRRPPADAPKPNSPPTPVTPTLRPRFTPTPSPRADLSASRQSPTPAQTTLVTPPSTSRGRPPVSRAITSELVQTSPPVRSAHVINHTKAPVPVEAPAAPLPPIRTTEPAIQPSVKESGSIFAVDASDIAQAIERSEPVINPARPAVPVAAPPQPLPPVRPTQPATRPSVQESGPISAVDASAIALAIDGAAPVFNPARQPVPVDATTPLPPVRPIQPATAQPMTDSGPTTADDVSETVQAIDRAASVINPSQPPVQVAAPTSLLSPARPIEPSTRSSMTELEPKAADDVSETAQAIELDPDEEEVADHYRGLVRNGESLEAVKEEMRNDGAPPRIQEAVVATFAPPPVPLLQSVPPTTTPDTSNATFASDSDDEVMEEGAPILPTTDRLVPKPADTKVHPVPVATPPKPSAVLEENQKLKQPRVEPPTVALATASAPKKKKPRKKTVKGTTLLENGAEQHCACAIM